MREKSPSPQTQHRVFLGVPSGTAFSPRCDSLCLPEMLSPLLIVLCEGRRKGTHIPFPRRRKSKEFLLKDSLLSEKSQDFVALAVVSWNTVSVLSLHVPYTTVHLLTHSTHVRFPVTFANSYRSPLLFQFNWPTCCCGRAILPRSCMVFLTGGPGLLL